MPSQVVSSYILSAREPVSDALPPTVLIAESNHRIANNLTLVAGLLHLHAKEIRAQGGLLTAERAWEILEEVSARIEAVGRLHRLLAAGSDGAVDLSDYLSHIGQAAAGSMSPMGGGDLALSVTSDGPCMVTADRALHVGLVVVELVTNAIKYAHPAEGVRGRIQLGCRRRSNGGLHVWVADDGVGLPDGFDAERDGGLGLRTLRALAKQIGATLTFECAGLGLTVHLVTPAS